MVARKLPAPKIILPDQVPLNRIAVKISAVVTVVTIMDLFNMLRNGVKEHIHGSLHSLIVCKHWLRKDGKKLNN